MEDDLRRALDRRKQRQRLRTLRRFDVTYDHRPRQESAALAESNDISAAPKLIDFSSNDYIGLSRSSALRAGFMRRMQEASSSSSMGSTGSRLLDGNTDEHESLEKRLCKHFNAPAALLFNSGFDANCSLLAFLPQPGDVIVYDELVHASMHDGMRASRVPASSRQSFKHNDMRDLGRVLEEVQKRSSSSTSSSRPPNVFVAVESVYSMDGDICPLALLLQTLDEHVPRKRRCLLVDEAHSVGLYGKQGTGIVPKLGLCEQVDLRLITFGKAFGCSGAAVLCSDIVKEYLVNYARPLVYSTALPTISLRLVEAALDVLCSDEGRERATTTFELVEAFHRSLTVQTQPEAHDQHPDLRSSPIVPVLSSRPRELAAFLISHGFLVRPIAYPTVPLGSERVRICIHANNDIKDVQDLAASINEWFAGGRETAGATSAPRQSPLPHSHLPAAALSRTDTTSKL